MPLSVKTESGMRYASAHVKVDGVWRKARQVYQKTATGWRPVWSYEWTTGDWGGCSATCGGGTQTRTVDCDRNDGVRVADALCETTKPAASNACNTQPCYTYNWYTGRWGSCNASCGTGTQTRTVYCRRNDGTQVADAFCSGGKPSASTSCSSCSGCSYNETAYINHKVIHCNYLKLNGRTNWTYAEVRSSIISTYGSVYNHYLGCSSYEKVCPYPSDACCAAAGYTDHGGQCSLAWVTGNFGSCSASCGTGTQTRTVTCKRTSDNATLSDSICSAFSGKPSASASCTSCSGCSYSETAMVYAKVKQLNALAVDGRTNWTYSQARSAILSNYSSVTQWWNVAGRNESICPYPSAACCSGYKYSQ